MTTACCILAIILAAALSPAPVSAAGETPRAMRFSAASPGEARQWQEKLRAALARCMKIEDQLADADTLSFDAEAIKPFDAGDGCEAREIRIRATPDRFLKAVIARPLSTYSGKAPAIAAIHGHGGSRYTPFDPEKPQYKRFGTALAQHGYIVISTDAGQHDVYEKGHTLMGERLHDLMRCVSYLASLPDVDPERIGCAGLSLGGEMAMWLGAMDTRVAATSSCGFLTRMDQMEENHCLCWKFDGLRALADFADIYALIAPRPLQCQNGKREPPTQFTVELAREAMREVRPAYRVFGKPDNVELHVHGGGHEIDLAPMIRFFKSHLAPPEHAAPARETP
jgi:hypothetical protein